MISIRMRRYAIYLGLALTILLVLNHLQYRPSIPTNLRAPSLPNIFPQNRPQDEKTVIHVQWSKRPIDYPVDQLTPLPSDPPRILPKVQHEFPPETPLHKQTRLARQKAVYETFARCWHSYKTHAFGHDELAPLSGGVHDGFGGWAATAVDNLDTLWLMDMKEEFEIAVQKVLEIDLGRVTLTSVNVFETTIRHLGGLIAAYDLSGDERLLAKAQEFGEMLLVPFDTPNHLPITRWDPQAAIRDKQVAGQATLVAEVGSLTMEFTRLSQLTGDTRWYDAVDRITRLFASQQDKTWLKGMWPVTVNPRYGDLTKDSLFTLSAMSDSLYEYFPKMYALLGGAENVYRKLYDGSMGTAIKYNLFRPMVPDSADILISGNVRAQEEGKPELEPQGQHLVCFAGGMFALGGKLFSQPLHVEIGKKLTDGCIWTYKHMPMGIMPEIFTMVPCESRSHCRWNSTRYHEIIRDTYEGEKPAEQYIAENRLPPGFVSLRDPRYILRPEAIESVFLLYRITGKESYFEAAWDMFTAIRNATETNLANAALADVSFSPEELKQQGKSVQYDSMESFWMAETLKYFYLIFSEPGLVDLDAWVFNTEAHMFRRPVPEEEE